MVLDRMDLNSAGIVKYVVTADDKLIDGQVERIKTIWYSFLKKRL
jgi:hypothetical protein